MNSVGTVALWSTVFGGIGAILGVLFKQGVDAYLRYRADKRVDIQQNEGTLVKGYEFVIAQVKEQNEKLEKERKEQITRLSNDLDTIRTKHFDCERVQEGLRVQNAAQQQDILELQSHITALQSQIDKYTRS